MIVCHLIAKMGLFVKVLRKAHGQRWSWLKKGPSTGSGSAYDLAYNVIERL